MIDTPSSSLPSGKRIIRNSIARTGRCFWLVRKRRGHGARHAEIIPPGQAGATVDEWKWNVFRDSCVVARVEWKRARERESRDAFSLRKIQSDSECKLCGSARARCTGRVLRGKENAREGPVFILRRLRELKSAGSVRMQWPDFARRALVLSNPFEQVVTNQIKAASR